MKALFNVLDTIVESGYTQENLASTDAVIACADAEGVLVNNNQAESIIRVGKRWLDQKKNGNGEWLRMREEAKAALTCYQHVDSGDVATAEMWESDFNSMGAESWLDGEGELLEVVWCAEEREWVDV